MQIYRAMGFICSEERAGIRTLLSRAGVSKSVLKLNKLSTTCRCTIKSKPKGSCKDNVKINLKEIQCDCTDWTELAQDRAQWLFLIL